MVRRPSRRTLKRLAATLGVLVVLGVAAGLRSDWEVTHTRLETVDVTSQKIATGRPLRIFQVTDLHDMPRQEQRRAIVTMAREQHPDLIAITGDLESVNTTSLVRVEAFVAALVKIGVPVYYVPGNHENDNQNPGTTVSDVLAMVERHGVTTLLNRHVTQDGPWGKLDVIGTDDHYTHRGDLSAAMNGTRPGAYHLLLTHSPLLIDALSTSTVDLAICGHTHGGQVRIPGIGALFTPGGGFLPTYDKGLFTVGKSLLYVDSGAGQSGGPRLDDQSEVTLLRVARR